MVSISITHNFPEIQRKLDQVGKQASYAAAVALTRTAQDTRADLRQEMRRVFDRPTAYTLNSLYLKPARRDDLKAIVWLKHSAGRVGEHYLLPQIRGGDRELKRFEQILVRAGYMSGNERAVPGGAARIDRHGNMSAGQIVQILSQLRAFKTVGGTSPNATNSARSRKKREQGRYFVSLGQGVVSRGFGSWQRGGRSQHLPRGVWMATDSGVKPILMFVPHAKYRARYEFFKVADRFIKPRFAFHFDAELRKALRTAW